jgi:hypothetical protein
MTVFLEVDHVDRRFPLPGEVNTLPLVTLSCLSGRENLSVWWATQAVVSPPC